MITNRPSRLLDVSATSRQRMAEIRAAKAASVSRQKLGQRIRAAREARGLSQLNLAAAAQISRGYRSQLEPDEPEPTLLIAARAAHALVACRWMNWRRV